MSHLIKYFKILGLTFTNKAAAEMRERIVELVPNADERTLLTTFHSFAADLLRQHGNHIGLKPDFTILSQDADRHSLLDEAIDHSETGQFGLWSEKLLPLISRLIEDNISPDKAPEAEVFQGGSFHHTEVNVITSVYRNYRALMIEKNALDFSGLIADDFGLLDQRVGVRKQIHRVYTYICVDEFQDTNLLQYKILHHLVNPDTKNLFVVADDDQIIYQWNGANPERIKALCDDFGGMRLLQLPENFRCPAAVVDLANRLIQNNFDRFEDKTNLTARKQITDTSPIFLKRFSDFNKEADWVAQNIAARPAEVQEKCVVLARTKRLLGQVIEAFKKHGIIGYLAARKNEFENASLQWVHSVLRLANSRNSREYLRRVCKAFFSLENIYLNVEDVIAQASSEEGDYLRAWAKSVLVRPELSDGTRRLIENLLPTLAERLDFWTFQDNAISWFDDLPGIAPDEKSIFDEYEGEKETWHRLVGEISTQYGKQKVTLHLLLQELDLRSKAPPPLKGAIPCFTIHASKGMEFDHVYLVGLVEDQLPSWLAVKKGDNSIEMREERRNCFVAITRAQETLTLTYSDHVQEWSKKPSRFLYEMGIIG